MKSILFLSAALATAPATDVVQAQLEVLAAVINSQSNLQGQIVTLDTADVEWRSIVLNFRAAEEFSPKTRAEISALSVSASGLCENAMTPWFVANRISVHHRLTAPSGETLVRTFVASECATPQSPQMPRSFKPTEEAPSNDTANLTDHLAALDLSACSLRNPCKGRSQAVSYSITSPTLASFSGGSEWAVSIDVDDFTDEKTCVLRTDRGIMSVSIPEIFMTIEGDTPTFSVFHSGERAYPMSLESYRVDQNRVLEKREDLEMRVPAASALLGQMRSGNSMRIAYINWPHEYREGSVIDLTGFSAIYGAARTLCSR